MAQPDNMMRDKVCLITGATAGIGLGTAEGLAKRGATVVLVGRSPQRGEAAVARIKEKTGSSAVEFMSCDLSVQAQVRQLAADFQLRYPQLDVLINNAGGFFHRRQESSDGIEMTWALNLLAPFLLTNLLLPSLEAGAPARILTVSSFIHRLARIRFQDLEGQRHYFRVTAYAQSKLAVILLAYELARRLAGTGVTANALDPGYVATDIISNNAVPAWRVFQAIATLIAVSPEEGAKTGIYLASSPEVEGVTGQYFKGEKPARSAPASYDQASAQRLWDACAKMVALD
jgi:NAD(P)-dependent dehydrogenase (short-subunit alcohol dehydrogenase family)